MSTTSLAHLRKGSPYVWGDIIKIHDIGEYAIIESKEGEVISFHPYVGDKNTMHRFETLVEAVVHAIAYKYDGLNTRAHNYFLKGIGYYEVPK